MRSALYLLLATQFMCLLVEAAPYYEILVSHYVNILENQVNYALGKGATLVGGSSSSTRYKGSTMFLQAVLWLSADDSPSYVAHVARQNRTKLEQNTTTGWFW
jgi:hypothetical protein